MSDSNLPTRHTWLAAVLFVGTSAMACSGAQTPAAKAADPAPSSPAATAKLAPPPNRPAVAAQDEAVESAPSEASATSSDGESDTTEDEAYRLERSPREVITTPDTTFSFNFTSSEIGEQTEARCRAEAGDDMEAYAGCKRKAQDKLGQKILRFAEKRGTWWWITYERRKNQLITLHKIPFEFDAETANTVTIRTTGKDKGLAPMARVPRKVVVTLPNSYSIELTDPKYGRMVYETRIELATN